MTIQELKKLDRINATILDFLKLETWTIAAGAMLISGVQPAVLATKIPDEGSHLSDPTLPASFGQLRSARSVMEDWADCHEDDDGSRSEVPTEVEPIKFLRWCEDEYLGSIRRPELLDHFLSLAGFQNAGPVRQDAVVARLLELEQHAVVERNRSPSVENETPSPHTGRLRPGHFVKRMAVLVDSGKITLPIATEIATALDKTSSTGIRQPMLVWRHLLDMAQSDDFPLLKFTGPSTLEIPSLKRPWAPYTYQALGQFLRRNETLLLDEEGNSG
ncbi:hypothetical protein SRS16CHR_04797 [Variovorax sp. SRS16]|nr:hypothetical protein SRS16CHR_04797 [Variovorax sp. SRS16]